MEKPTGKSSKVAALENEITGLKLLLNAAKQSIESNLEKQQELEKKISTLEIENNNAVAKNDCLSTTMKEIQRDVIYYRTEDVKKQKKLECMEKAMSKVISPTLHAAIMAKVEEEMDAMVENLVKELEAKMRKDLLMDLPDDLDDDSAGSSARTASSESPHASSSGMTDAQPLKFPDKYFY